MIWNLDERSDDKPGIHNKNSEISKYETLQIH